jgi:hypothetical protein
MLPIERDESNRDEFMKPRGRWPKMFGKYWSRSNALDLYSVRTMAVLTEGFLGFPQFSTPMLG